MEKKQEYKYQVILSTDGKLTVMSGVDTAAEVDKAYELILPTFKKMALLVKELGIEKKSFGGGFAKKEKAWTGEVCPKDGGRLYKVDYVSKKTGKAGSMLKCENSKYDFTTKETSGCSWVGFGSSLKEIEEKEKVRNFESEYGNA